MRLLTALAICTLSLSTLVCASPSRNDEINAGSPPTTIPFIKPPSSASGNVNCVYSKQHTVVTPNSDGSFDISSSGGEATCTSGE